MADNHFGYMRQLWLRVLSSHPDEIDEIEHMLRQHGGTGHFVSSGIKMVNLWKNMQSQMQGIK